MKYLKFQSTIYILILLMVFNINALNKLKETSHSNKNLDRLKLIKKENNLNEITKSKKKNRSEETVCYKDLHKPFENEEGSSFYVIIVSALVMLTLRFVKKIICNNSVFTIRSMSSILNYNLIYCICFSIFFIFYSYGVLDSFNTNIEKVFIGFVIFAFIWNIYLVILCLSFSSYNEFLKTFDDKNYDFKSLKVEYERAVNSKYNLNKLDESFRSDTSNTVAKNIENTLNYFSLLIMKYYFILPFEPKFKSFKLKKDFPFGNYLSECLLIELKGFFSITWTSIVSFLTLVVIWTQIIEVKEYHVSIFKI